ncbi:MAG: hypothetical protein LBD49_06140 [Oscillospiraceae bacterium]|jgi:hypothetical protein|nr:hypothetical protein [Oscillospiraceae bacterium]
MRRGDLFIKLVSAALFIAVVSHIGLYAYSALKNPFRTVSAESGEYSSSARAQGYVVRSERVVQGGAGEMTPAVSEGEKVAAGALIANGYSGAQALAQADEARALRLRIAQLEENRNLPAASGASSPAFDAAFALSLAVQRRGFGELEQLCLRVGSVVFTLAGDPETSLVELRDRLAALEASQTGVSRVYAPVSGVFSSAVDGFERVAPDALELVLTPGALSDMFAYAAPQSDGVAGKLITGITWYYAATIEESAAADLEAGREADVGFTGARRMTFRMRVDAVYPPEGGGCVVVFSCRSGMDKIASLRYSEADVALDSVTGLRVPKQALHLGDDGRTYVYVYSGGRAHLEYAEILGESDDVYIVRDNAREGGSLRRGAEIIVKGNGLYDGKVIRR